MWPRAASLGLLLMAACADPRLDRPEPAARARPRSLEWSHATAELEPDGRTQPVAFELADTPAVFGVRAYAEPAADSSEHCFQLEDVIVADDQSWVGTATSADYDDYCESCAQRVAVGAGYGFFVLPSGPEPPIALGRVQLRVALRDCLTLTPLDAAAARPPALRVDYAAWRPPPRKLALRLGLGVVNASQYALARDPELLARALVRVRDIWREAGIELVIPDTRVIEAEPGPLLYSA
ncbi:MAG TPA: hypothetical protein VJR89_25030, partial [Polyangiales bacterium]|nr:hypothetical protein [Polyangiales bacterium]